MQNQKREVDYFQNDADIEQKMNAVVIEYLQLYEEDLWKLLR